MIDLHTHTTESDGTFSPGQLIAEASRVGLEALGITDHDTFSGYDQAALLHAANGGPELICGIELATKFHGESVHLLAFFLKNPPSKEFREWIVSLEAGRRQRNQELVEKLCAAGMPITMEEVAARGRKLIARPHFAAEMVAKGYVASLDEAFDRYLDEAGSCFVPREEPALEAAVGRIRAAGGLAVLPHPNRIKASEDGLANIVKEMRGIGLGAIEVYHSDHSPEQMELYASLARKFGLKVSGGSDFHGANKPRVALGTGIGGNLEVPYRVLEQLRDG